MSLNHEKGTKEKRKSKSFLSRLPRISFIQNGDRKKTEHPTEDPAGPEISGVLPGSFKKDVSFHVDSDGKLDLSTVPAEFREIVQQLYEKVAQPKFIEDHTDQTATLRRKQGPRVEKGMDDENILMIMKTLVNVGNPWDYYAKVRNNNCLKALNLGNINILLS